MRFYSDLPILTDFSAVTQPERFAPLPEAFKERAAALV